MEIRVEGLDELEQVLHGAPAKFGGYMRRFMNQALPLVEREVKVRTPVNLGALRSSITYEVRGMGAQMQGIVGSPKQYAPFVETGTRPHWPPFAAIEHWVRRKLHPPAEQLYVVVRGVQRAIAARGTKGSQMFQKALEATQGRVRQMWADTWARAVEKDL